MYEFKVYCAAFSFIQMKRVISMSVKIGDVSGCLKVIPFSAPYEQEVAKAMHDAAEVEWHIDRQGLESLFSCFFKLTKEEQALYREQGM